MAGDEVLLAQRSKPPLLYGLWEFPGGKIEPGESEEEALKRELAEELNFDLRAPVMKLGRFSDGHVELHAFIAQVEKSNVEARVHLDVRWVKLHDVPAMPLVEADRPIINAFLKRRALNKTP